MRKIVLKMVLHLLTSIGLLSLVLIGGFFVMRQLSFQSTLSLAEAVNQQGGISEMREVSLGGISQYIAIEGENRDNPVCLFLHGGPGLSLPYGVSSRHQVETVSSHCNVVYWDQRGAGKTYSQNKEAVDFTYAQLESDAKELIAYLREEFDQEKIYLIGYSWGSVLGLRLAAKIPEQLAGYFGLSQVVSSRDSERLLYDWLLDEFETTGRHQLVTQLKKLGLPPYQKESSQQAFQEVMTEAYDTLFRASNQTLTKSAYWEELQAVDLLTEIQEIQIPLYFATGAGDYICPVSLVEKLMDQVVAPEKEVLILEHSAHYFSEEDEKNLYEWMKEKMKGGSSQEVEEDQTVGEIISNLLK